jgi:hypothetical protein
MLVSDRDDVIIEGDDPGIGDGDAKNVAREVIEHGLLALAPTGNMNNPRFGPGGIIRRDQIGTFGCQQSPEFAAHKLSEGRIRNEKGVAGRMPVAAICGNAAPGNQAMDVGVKDKLLCPGVEDGEHTNGAADKAAVAGDFNDGHGGGLHQHSIAVTLVGAQNIAKFLRYCDDNVEIVGGKQFGLAICKPGFSLIGMALGTAAISARVIRKHFVATMIATPEVPSERLCAASENVGDGTAMRRRHRRAMCLEIVLREPAEDVGNFDHGVSPEVRGRGQP